MKKPGGCWEGGRDDVVVVWKGVAGCLKKGNVIHALEGCRRMLPVNYEEWKKMLAFVPN